MKLVPKCSTPMHRQTASRRGHCPAGGRLITNTSGSASKAKRSAVNSSGGTSRIASAEVRKLPAQASTISRIRT